MWQNDDNNFELLDVLTVLSVIMQIQSGDQFEHLQKQIDRIERKIDMLLLRKEG